MTRKERASTMLDLILDDRTPEGELKIDSSQFKVVCDKALEMEGVTADVEIELVLTDNAEIREINKEYREIDKATDVLSFPMIDFDNGETIEDGDKNPETGFVSLGSIIISVERAKKQAKEYGHSLRREIAFLTAHSMLHLLGFDHVNSEEEEKIMFDKQEAILSALGIGRE